MQNSGNICYHSPQNILPSCMSSQIVKDYNVKSAINLGTEFCFVCETWEDQDVGGWTILKWILEK
jgi:hypothetical protein